MKKTLTIFFLLLLSIGIIHAQTRSVKGIVVDETNEPLIGVTVSVKGSTTGTLTDVDGKFTLSVSQNIKSITFSFVGYETLDVTISDDMKVSMKPTTNQLTEVVITGMTAMDKRLFTGATDQLKAEDIKLDGLAEVSRALEGRAAGVSVQNLSGTFGTAPKISVRGATSIYGDSKPLWVVDGVIMEDVVEVSTDQLSSGDATTLISSAIAGLNADDIESFQILKDGSATSIYGARAMAGVIVVTTKKGVPGISTINYTGEFTTRLIPSYNDFNIMNSQEQMGVYRELEQKGWLTFAESYRRSSSGVYGKMYQLINTYDPVTGQAALLNTRSSRNAYLRSAEMRNTDWFDELFSSNISQLHSVSISTGSEKTRAYASVSAMFDPGWYRKSKVDRYTGNLNVTHKALNNLSVNIITNASYRKQEAPGTLSQNVDVVNGEVKRDFDINPYSYSMNTSRALDPNEFYTRNYSPFNIMHELDNNYIDLNVIDFKVQGEIKWNVIRGLELAVLGAMKYSSTSQEHYVMDDSNQALAYRAMGDYTIQQRNNYLYTNPDIPYSFPTTVLPEGGFYFRNDYNMHSYDFRATAKYNASFGQKHIGSLFGGIETNAADRKTSSFDGIGMQYGLGEIPFYVYEYFKKGVESGNSYYSKGITRTRTAAYFMQLFYNYDNRYTFNSTIRYEGSNKLGKSRQARWLPTWNLAGGWTISEENFFENLKGAASHLNIRASYALSADRGPNISSASLLLYSQNPYRPFSADKESSLYISSLANEDLTYEKKHEFNFGLDAGFLKNRLNMAFEVYSRKMSDLIGIINTQGIGGQVSKFANVAKMKSHGIELTISSKNIQTKDFTWNTDFIFGNAKTEITELYGNSRIIDLVWTSGNNFVKGYPHRAIFSIPFAGLDEAGIPTFYDKDGSVISGTEINMQNRENAHDFLKYEGPADPTITGSFGNLFSYKNFRLNVFFTYAFGNKLRLDPVFSAAYNDLMATPKEFKNRWTMPGDESQTNIPVIITTRQYNDLADIKKRYNAYNYSDVRVAKGDFIRLKEVSLTYDIPKRLLGHHVNKLSSKLQATNLFLVYADKKLNGQDPEFFNSGGVAAPVPRQFTFSVRLGL